MKRQLVVLLALCMLLSLLLPMAQSTNRLATSANDEHKNNLFIFYNIKLNTF